MSGVEIRELECFLVLSEELHFGRAAERLYVSQSRVSQLLGALERRIGGRLLERTSRRVSLTPLGEGFLSELRPSYEALRATVERARASARGGLEGTLRVGFLGSADERVMGALSAFRERHPHCEVAPVEIPLADPFGAVRRGDVDAAIVCLPVAEPDLVIGSVFSRQPQLLAVPLGHPLAGRATLGAEELADCRLIGLRGPAPRYWREFMAPTTTPSGRPVAPGPQVRTLQEGLTAVAAGLGTMLLCAPTATHQNRRDIAFVPVTGLPPSALALIWPHSRESARHRALSQLMTDQLVTPVGA
ncbi:LysR family transcriptional regulator [Streptomyces buecherae]|uniref:LysR family transcriptional regulator n=2 Tax=Streptomyces TaxID=1883 RepID=UPI001C27EE8E|nr:LysR family transcriptional regulator [Streptomyces buecherae]